MCIKCASQIALSFSSLLFLSLFLYLSLSLSLSVFASLWERSFQFSYPIIISRYRIILKPRIAFWLHCVLFDYQFRMIRFSPILLVLFVCKYRNGYDNYYQIIVHNSIDLSSNVSFLLEAVFIAETNCEKKSTVIHVDLYCNPYFILWFNNAIYIFSLARYHVVSRFSLSAF